MLDKPFDCQPGLEKSSAHPTGSSGLSIRGVLRGSELIRPMLSCWPGPFPEECGLAWKLSLTMKEQVSVNHHLCIHLGCESILGEGSQQHISISAAMCLNVWCIDSLNCKRESINFQRYTKAKPCGNRYYLLWIWLATKADINKRTYTAVICLSKVCLKDIVECLMI